MLRRRSLLLLSLAACFVVASSAGCRKSRHEESGAASITAAEHPLTTATVQNRGPETSRNMLRVHTYTGMSAPANAFYDAQADRYLVSNVAGALTAVDGNGFISVLSPEGTVTDARWIAGGKNGVTLNAPKGLAVAGDLLYVADIDTVRWFDTKTGAPRGSVKIPGATYLAGMAAGPDGRVFVADAAIAIAEDGSTQSVGDGAIWTIEAPGRPPKKLETHGDLGGPSAIAVRPDGTLLVATLESGAVYHLDTQGRKHDQLETSRGKLDGIVEVDDKIFVSSWGAAAVYRRIEGGTFAVELAELKAPGGLAFDAKRRVLVVPLLREDRVETFTVR